METQRTVLWTRGGGRREGGRWREWHGDVHTTMRETAGQWSLLCDSGSSHRGSVTTHGVGREAGGKFERERTQVCLGLIHVNVRWKPARFCRAITHPLNINFKKIRNEVILELHVF